MIVKLCRDIVSFSASQSDMLSIAEQWQHEISQKAPPGSKITATIELMNARVFAQVEPCVTAVSHTVFMHTFV